MSQKVQDAHQLTFQLKRQAQSLGFDLVSVIPARPTRTAPAYRAWIEAGYHGKLGYLERRSEERSDPRQLLPETPSIVVVGMNYYTTDRGETDAVSPDRGVVARYALNDDYHDFMAARLRRLAIWLEGELATRELSARVYVDTGPVLERELAARAGLGFIGKNTCLIHPEYGSWLLLAELLIDVELAYDPPPTTASTPPPSGADPGLLDLAHNELGTCGTCTRCLKACPTDAFPEPYVLDATRCISYLTIELKDSIPYELREPMGNLIFGCDICQDVCPWNRRFQQPGREPGFQARADLGAADLKALMMLDEEGFRRRFRGSPIRRARRRGLLRNVAVALGNRKDPDAVPALIHALSDHEPLIRAHAAWALGQIGGDNALSALRARATHEEEPEVCEEIRRALRVPLSD